MAAAAAAGLFNFGTHTGLSGGSTSGSLTGIASYQVTASPTITTAGAPNTAVQGIGTDQFGNLYITSSTQISEVPNEGTAVNFTDEFGIVSGLTTNAIFSPSVDGNGNIYFAGYHGLLEMEVRRAQLRHAGGWHCADHRTGADAVLQHVDDDRRQLFPDRLAHFQFFCSTAAKLPLQRNQNVRVRNYVYRCADLLGDDQFSAGPSRAAEGLVHAAHQRRCRRCRPSTCRGPVPVLCRSSFPARPRSSSTAPA